MRFKLAKGVLFIGLALVLSCAKNQKPAKNLNTMTKNGLVSITSTYPPQETVDRVKSLLEEQEFHIFTTIDHAKSAQKNNRELNPTTLIIFGNPKTGGTGLMKENQTIGIDLPAKILVWQDDDNTTHISYNKIQWLADRHDLSNKNQTVIDKLDKSITEVTQKAAH